MKKQYFCFCHQKHTTSNLIQNIFSLSALLLPIHFECEQWWKAITTNSLTERARTRNGHWMKERARRLVRVCENNNIRRKIEHLLCFVICIDTHTRMWLHCYCSLCHCILFIPFVCKKHRSQNSNNFRSISFALFLSFTHFIYTQKTLVLFHGECKDAAWARKRKKRNARVNKVGTMCATQVNEQGNEREKEWERDRHNGKIESHPNYVEEYYFLKFSTILTWL